MSSQPIKPRQPLSVKNVTHNPSTSKLHPTDDAQTGLKSPSLAGSPAFGGGYGGGGDSKQQQQAWGRPVSRLPQSTRKPASKLKAPRSPPPTSTLLTPKKRAVPQEEVHCRNVVTGNSPSASKRSRSSNTESGSGSEAKPPSTGTSLGISAGLNDIHVGGGRSTLVQGPAAAVGGPLMRTNATPSSRPTATIAAPSLPPPHPRPTTTRIDKHSRMTEAERATRELNKKQASEEWRKKYLKAFPSFVFHLDGLDAATKQQVEQSITQLGARIEPFFSRSVSHLVTARKPSAAPSQTASASRAGAMPGTPLRKQQPAASGSKKSRHKTQPVHSDRNPFEDAGPPAPSNDIIFKAEEFGMKVWNLEKLSSVLASLLGNSLAPGPSNDTNTRQGLEQMLKQERLQGTSERDPNAARADYHYFNKSCCYILVEDATCEHRVIMAQEYEKPANRDEEPAWPKLYGEIEGRCPFTKFDVSGDYRKRMRGNHPGTLRRTVSMSQIDRGHLRARQGGSASPQPAGPLGSIARHFNPARGASPYPMASGNSMALTSNMNSTTSAAIGSQASFGASAVAIDKRFAQLGRRVHTPGISPLAIRGTMASGLGISSALPSPTVPGALAASAGSARSLSASHDNGAVVRRMLGMTERPVGGIRRSVSTASAGRTLHREKKPGYCENCRVKYSDFDEHINHRKHRKFAADSANFADVDRLLARVERPLASWVEYDDYSAQGSRSPVDEMPVVPGYQMDGSEAYLVADEQGALPGEEQMYAEYFEGVGEASIETTDETRTPQTSPDAQRLLYDPKNHQQQLFDPTTGYYVEEGEVADWSAVPHAQ